MWLHVLGQHLPVLRCAGVGRFREESLMVWPESWWVSRTYVEWIADELGGTAAAALEKAIELGIENPEFYEDKTGIYLKED